ncbi:hypothetical protein D3C81_2238950 [compost metagenome]
MRSATASASANASSNQTSSTGLPAWMAAMVSAPKATNSPWGMNSTRVTVKTSRIDNANSA